MFPLLEAVLLQSINHLYLLTLCFDAITGMNVLHQFNRYLHKLISGLMIPVFLEKVNLFNVYEYYQQSVGLYMTVSSSMFPHLQIDLSFIYFVNNLVPTK